MMRLDVTSTNTFVVPSLVDAEVALLLLCAKMAKGTTENAVVLEKLGIKYYGFRLVQYRYVSKFRSRQSSSTNNGDSFPVSVPNRSVLFTMGLKSGSNGRASSIFVRPHEK